MRTFFGAHRNILNGHFNPLVLSTFASEPTESRDKELFGGYLESAKHKSDSAITNTLINIHEMDHFTRYVGSELGVLMTLLCHLKHYYLIGLADLLSSLNLKPPVPKAMYRRPPLKDQMECIETFQRLEDVLWFGQSKFTQGQMVDDLNWAMRDLGIEEQVFCTANPESPAAPDQPSGLLHLLESSAVFLEMEFLALSGISGERWHRLMGFDQRDPGLYFELGKWVLGNCFGLHMLAALAIRMSLDVRVPGLLTPPGSVDWSMFQPGYRLNNYIHYARAAVEDLGYDLDLLRSQHERQFYASTIDKFIGQMAKRAASSGEVLWNDVRLSAFDRSYAGFLSRMPAGCVAKNSGNLLRASAAVIRFLFDSAAQLHARQDHGPGEFYMYLRLRLDPWSHLIGWLQRAFKSKQAIWPQPLFNVNGGIHRSEHIETRVVDVLNAELLAVRMDVVSRILDAEKWSAVREEALDNFKSDNPQLDRVFREWTEKTLQEVETRYASLLRH